jgi:hypothetical protein
VQSLHDFVVVGQDVGTEGAVHEVVPELAIGLEVELVEHLETLERGGEVGVAQLVGPEVP